MSTIIAVLFSILVQIVLSRGVGELVCRQCGATITLESELMNATAPEEKYNYKYEFSLVGRNTTVHVFNNPAGHTFHVFGAKTAHLKFQSQPSMDATWFPGMQWTVCGCSRCGHHMGWYFQPIRSDLQSSSPRSFVGLVLNNLISADYVDSLAVMPV